MKRRVRQPTPKRAGWRTLTSPFGASLRTSDSASPTVIELCFDDELCENTGHEYAIQLRPERHQ